MPRDGWLVQTPQGVASVNFRLNGVSVGLGSTAYFSYEGTNALRVNVYGDSFQYRASVTVLKGKAARVRLPATSTATPTATERPASARLSCQLPPPRLAI